MLEGQFEDLEAQTEGLADLVHSRAVVLEVRDHLARHLGRVGGDAARRDAVEKAALLCPAQAISVVETP